MFNVCDRCGLYAADMSIECRDDQSVAVCPSCGHAHPFVQLPLYIVTGASGTGKSTVVPLLAKQAQTHVVLDTDTHHATRHIRHRTRRNGQEHPRLGSTQSMSSDLFQITLCY